MLSLTKGAVFAAGVLSAGAYTPEALADQVTALPGAEGLNINFNQFSGYLTVDGTKQMHYWFVESMNDPANAPVAFWTNGGMFYTVTITCDLDYRWPGLQWSSRISYRAGTFPP